MKHHEEQVAKRYKALSCLHLAVSDEIFNRIISCETTKEVWDKIQKEFQGDKKIRKMQILNLRREFEAMKMKDSETVMEFNDRIMKGVNQIRHLGEEFTEQRLVEKVLVSLPERF